MSDGFTSGEISFYIKSYKSKANLGGTVQLVFRITQHTRYEALMNNLISYFDGGNVVIKTKSQFT